MILATLALVVVACGGASGNSVGGSDPAPNFSFTLFQGEDELGAREMDLDQLHGKPIVLNFWAGLCPPCRAEMPDLQAFYEDFKDRVTLLGIDLGQFTGLGSERDAMNLLEELGISYPTGTTSDAGIIRDYRLLGLPATVFIDSEGKIFKHWGGVLNKDVLLEQTNAMLSR